MRVIPGRGLGDLGPAWRGLLQALGKRVVLVLLIYNVFTNKPFNKESFFCLSQCPPRVCSTPEPSTRLSYEISSVWPILPPNPFL